MSERQARAAGSGEGLTDAEALDVSLVRRLRFAAAALCLSEKLAARLRLRRFGTPGRWIQPPLVLEKLLSIGFDLIECVRLRRRLPRIGTARRAVVDTRAVLPQPPRFPGYWSDPGIGSLVGLQLGVDLIRHDGHYYLLELNLDAALRPARRLLYPGLDPIVSGLCELAHSRGFERLWAYVRSWPPGYPEEFERAGRELGLEVVAASSPYYAPDTAHPWVEIPTPLPPKTLVAQFSDRRSALAYYVQNKLSSAIWMPELLAKRGHDDGLLRHPETWQRLTVPPLGADPRFPNLVVKLGDFDRGEYVRLLRVRDEAEALDALGMRDPEDFPRVLDLRGANRLQRLVSDKGTPLYQPFIPPDLDERGRTGKYRLHLFASPLADVFLSVHKHVPERGVANLPFGLVEDDSPYVPGFARGAQYVRAEPEVEADMQTVTRELGALLRTAIGRRFQTSP
jgi:hypothetical protein